MLLTRRDQNLSRILFSLCLQYFDLVSISTREANFHDIWKLLFAYSASSDNFWKFELLSIKIRPNLASLRPNLGRLPLPVSEEKLSHLKLAMTMNLTKTTLRKRVSVVVQNSIFVRLSSYVTQKIRIELLSKFLETKMNKNQKLKLYKKESPPHICYTYGDRFLIVIWRVFDPAFYWLLSQKLW